MYSAPPGFSTLWYKTTSLILVEPVLIPPRLVKSLESPSLETELSSFEILARVRWGEYCTFPGSAPKTGSWMIFCASEVTSRGFSTPSQRMRGLRREGNTPSLENERSNAENSRQISPSRLLIPGMRRSSRSPKNSSVR